MPGVFLSIRGEVIGSHLCQIQNLKNLFFVLSMLGQDGVREKESRVNEGPGDTSPGRVGI